MISALILIEVLNMTKRFDIGELYVTRGVEDVIIKHDKFLDFINDAFCNKYIMCDWGDTCQEDSKSNDEAIKNGERILAVYKYNERLIIWIITEADRSRTTILFPHEY